MEAVLSAVARLNLYEGKYTDPDYILSSLILDNDELLYEMRPGFKVISGKVGGGSDGKPLNALQIGKLGAFVVKDALRIPLQVKVIPGHQPANAR